MDAKINVKLDRNEALVLRENEVCFKRVLTPAVNRLRCFECQSIDDFAETSPAFLQNRNPGPDTIDNIYYNSSTSC